jgi:hypothetical protein
VDTRVDEELLELLENLLIEMAQTKRSSTGRPEERGARKGDRKNPLAGARRVRRQAHQQGEELPRHARRSSPRDRLAVLTQAVAARCGRSDVAEFLADWLDERQPLVADCQRAVTWFAAHTDTASERAG